MATQQLQSGRGAVNRRPRRIRRADGQWLANRVTPTTAPQWTTDRAAAHLAMPATACRLLGVLALDWHVEAETE